MDPAAPSANTADASLADTVVMPSNNCETVGLSLAFKNIVEPRPPHSSNAGRENRNLWPARNSPLSSSSNAT